MKSGQNAPGVSPGNLSPKYSVNGHKRTRGSNEQSGIHKYAINGHKRTPGSSEQSGIHKYSINGHKRTPVAQTSNLEYTHIQ